MPICRRAATIAAESRRITPSQNIGTPAFMLGASRPTAPKSMNVMLPSGFTMMLPGCGSA
jgi:hypothetical protein